MLAAHFVGFDAALCFVANRLLNRLTVRVVGVDLNLLPCSRLPYIP